MNDQIFNQQSNRKSSSIQNLYMQCLSYKCLLGGTQGEFTSKPRGIIWIVSTQIRRFLRQSDGEAEPHDQWPKKTQGGHQARSSPLISDGSRDGQQAGRLDLVRSGQKTLKTKLNLKGNYQARVHSGQTVLVVVNQGG
jgi:hypothetical protein